MSTIVINVDDSSSAKLFLDLARKLHFEAKVLSDAQKEDWALLSMMGSRKDEPSVPIGDTLDILKKVKSKKG